MRRDSWDRYTTPRPFWRREVGGAPYWLLGVAFGIVIPALTAVVVLALMAKV